MRSLDEYFDMVISFDLLFSFLCLCFELYECGPVIFLYFQLTVGVFCNYSSKPLSSSPNENWASILNLIVASHRFRAIG